MSAHGTRRRASFSIEAEFFSGRETGVGWTRIVCGTQGNRRRDRRQFGERGAAHPRPAMANPRDGAEPRHREKANGGANDFRIGIETRQEQSRPDGAGEPDNE